VPAGFPSAPANDEVRFCDHGPQLAPDHEPLFKAEYQDLDESNDGVNVAMGFVF
jgi:hypothetical protein